jgi:general secretion pathway protein F
MEGQSLSAAMSEHPGLFPRLYTAAVAAGERAGRLESVLERLADHAEQREAMSRGVGLALIYPVLLALIALGVVWGLIGFVVPRVAGVFDTAGQELPWITRSLLAVSDLVARHGLWLMLGLVLLGFLACWPGAAARDPRIDRRGSCCGCRWPAAWFGRARPRTSPAPWPF